jgi:hypothetical protein
LLTVSKAISPTFLLILLTGSKSISPALLLVFLEAVELTQYLYIIRVPTEPKEKI